MEFILDKMKDVKVLEENKLKVIEDFNRSFSELYLLVENQCQEEIELTDVVRVMEEVYMLILQKDITKTKIKNLETENNILKELLIKKEIELYSEKSICNKQTVKKVV